MTTRILTVSALAIMALSPLVTTTAQAEDAAFSADQTKEIISILEKHLQDKPDIVIDAIKKFEENEQAAEEQKAKASITDNLAKLNAADLPSFGNPDGDVTVVEFFDYNCGYCKRAVPDIQKITAKDKNVRFVFQEMPILGPSSRTAAQYALAAHKQGKYFDYHAALMKARGQKNAASLEKIGKTLGLDVDQLKADAKSAEVKQQIEDSITLASTIGIRGTPAFIVDGKLFRGYLGPDGLQDEINKSRESKDK